METPRSMFSDSPSPLHFPVFLKNYYLFIWLHYILIVRSLAAARKLLAAACGV